MKKKLYSWIWRWHFIGGILSLPFILIIALTGTIYLFKDNYEKPTFDAFKKVAIQDSKVPYQNQWLTAQANWEKPLDALVLPKEEDDATEFVSGRFSHKSSIFINPYTNEVTGKIITNQTDMHKVRKLHGELLLGKFGTKIIELVASWMVVLILTGLVLFWPRGRGIKGLFMVRKNEGKRLFYRDLHAVTGFWFSIVLLMILAGGLPWTDVWGGGFKKVQDATESGYPVTWDGRAFNSTIVGEPLSLDAMVLKAQELDLVGTVSIQLPKSPESVFSISNETKQFREMKMMHFDRYSGELLHQDSWADIGNMMQARQWIMAFHQGEFGRWNFILILFTAVALMFLSITAILSYLKRKPKNGWGIPNMPESLNLSLLLIVLIVVLGIFLPLFGLSVVLIFIGAYIKSKLMITHSK